MPDFHLEPNARDPVDNGHLCDALSDRLWEESEITACPACGGKDSGPGDGERRGEWDETTFTISCPCGEAVCWDSLGREAQEARDEWGD